MKAQFSTLRLDQHLGGRRMLGDFGANKGELYEGDDDEGEVSGDPGGETMAGGEDWKRGGGSSS